MAVQRAGILNTFRAICSLSFALFAVNGQYQKVIPVTPAEETVQQLAVQAGATVDLKCPLTEKAFNVIWKKGENVLFAGELKLSEDKKFSMIGTTLKISSVTPLYSDMYVCGLRLNPLKTTRYSLSIVESETEATNVQLPVAEALEEMLNVDYSVGDVMALKCPIGSDAASRTWKLGATSVLFLGVKKLTPDKRLAEKVENADTVLTLTGLKESDSGDYTCQYSQVPVKKIIYKVKVKPVATLAPLTSSTYQTVDKSGGQFTLEDVNMLGAVGDALELKCTDGAAFVIHWTRGADILFANGHKFSKEDKFSLKNDNLIIHDLKPSDSGEYRCKQNGYPPKVIRFHVSVKGKSTPEPMPMLYSTAPPMRMGSQAQTLDSRIQELKNILDDIRERQQPTDLKERLHALEASVAKFADAFDWFKENVKNPDQLLARLNSLSGFIKNVDSKFCNKN